MTLSFWMILIILCAAGLVFRLRHRLLREPFEESTIPRIVWQTYKTKDLPKEAGKCQKTWKAIALENQFDYRFFDDAAIAAFMKAHFNVQTNRVFHSFPLGVMRADMWRYCVLYVFGGIYSDIDSIALRPISAWNIQSRDKLVIGLENDVHFCQWTIAAVPGHPVLQMVIDTIVAEALRGVDIKNEHFVHQHTGPGIWTRAIHQTLGYPIEQKARHTFELSRTTDRKRFEQLGIRLENELFFSKQMVKNLFGSTQFSDGYASWMTERDTIHRAAQGSP